MLTLIFRWRHPVQATYALRRVAKRLEEIAVVVEFAMNGYTIFFEESGSRRAYMVPNMFGSLHFSGTFREEHCQW
jgi:hypothetical protein